MLLGGRMIAATARRPLLERWRAAWDEAGTPGKRFQVFAGYLGLRLWATIIGLFPVEMNLRTARLMGRIWWFLSPKHRRRALENLRPALGDSRTEGELRRIALRSFEHFAQVYLVELVQTPRLITEWSWARRVELGDLSTALRQLLLGSGTVMITPHFGNYELLGYTIAKLGIPLHAVMRPLDNPLLNEFLENSRLQAGVTLIYKKGATELAGEVLDGGGALCFIADQDAGRKCVFSDFFGRKASWYKSVGLVVMTKRIPLVVGHAVRTRQGFCYRIEVELIIRPEEWEAQDNPLQWVTDQYAAAFEAAIRRWPEQYLWMHRRWKTRPRSELAAEAQRPG